MRTARFQRVRRSKGSVLIIVLWIAFGLVSIALYFAHSMSFEMRAADNRVAAVEAEQAIQGAARYLAYVLANNEEPGRIPDLLMYHQEDVPVGESAFWLIGRPDQRTASTVNRDATAATAGNSQTAYLTPVFGLVDEASKLNLNTATVEMLQTLPGMTVELAAAIIDWRDSDGEITESGAESQYYTMKRPAYNCKNAPFETMEELRMVAGADLTILFGEDSNLNGILDVNENDGPVSLPEDNRDGRLDPGIFEYVTVWSKQPNTRTNGAARVSVANVQNPMMSELLNEKFGQNRATEIMGRLGGGGGPGGGGPGGGGGTQLRSVLEFFVRGGITAEESAEIEMDLTTSTNGTYLEGMININTASEAVLACVPGIGVDKSSTVIAYRQSNAGSASSILWLVEAIGEESALQAGPYITGQSYQFMADIAAVGHFDRGYKRVRFIFDTADGTPRIVHRQDMSEMGWALGMEVRQRLLASQKRT